MKCGLQFCFECDSINGKVNIQIFNEFVMFTPIQFIKHSSVKKSGYTQGNWDEKKHKQIIEKSDSKDSIIITGKNYNLFISTDTRGVEKSHRSITIVQDLELCIDYLIKINKITKLQGFVSAFLYDEEYTTAQSSKNKDELEERGLLHKLNGIKVIKNKYGEQELDISNNPGRKILINGSWLLPASKMWFAKPFFQIVSKEKILQFNHAEEIVELPLEIIFVDLFNKIDDSNTSINQERQFKFMEYIGA